MTTTLNIDPSHQFDLKVQQDAFMEAAPSGWEVVDTGDPLCTDCGVRITSIGIVVNDEFDQGPNGHVDNAVLISDVHRLMVKSALLAGWDGISGCWGENWPEMVEIAAELKAEGFGAIR